MRHAVHLVCVRQRSAAAAAGSGRDGRRLAVLGVRHRLRDLHRRAYRGGNNPNARDYANFGAVPRPSLMANDPRGWCPSNGTRAEPPRRGHDSDVHEPGRCLDGLRHRILRAQLQRRPAATGVLPRRGGRQLAEARTQQIPAYFYQIDDSGMQRFLTDGRTIARRPRLPSGDLSGRDVRGAFVVDGNLFYGDADGTCTGATSTANALGPAEKVDPYTDPTWANVSNRCRLLRVPGQGAADLQPVQDPDQRLGGQGQHALLHAAGGQFVVPHRFQRGLRHHRAFRLLPMLQPDR